jgi:hypothetical protein
MERMTSDVGSKTLREFKAVHIDQDYSSGITGLHENELFYNCTFDKVTGLTLKDCVLENSKFKTSKLSDVVGFTLTLGDCNSFENVEYSDFLFDLYLVMAIKSAGNTEKRKKLIELVGKERVIEILRQFSTIG